ncbi:NAD(P)-binding domain-containing protein [Kozakia baliensis]|uniref:NAD(P)-dependent oxidoreductase n=1 Tax=Kozakia baliensis TaxID=153496 RepID=UPI00345BB469
MNIGFVGLGTMSQLMARRLLAAGHHLVVHDRVSPRAETLIARGAVLVETPASVAWEVDIVFSMPGEDAAAQEMTFGEDGIATGLSPKAIHVGCGTLSGAQARRLREGHAQRGQTYVGAMIVEGPAGAEAGELVVLASGADNVWRRLEPVLKCLGFHVLRTGDHFRQTSPGGRHGPSMPVSQSVVRYPVFSCRTVRLT